LEKKAPQQLGVAEASSSVIDTKAMRLGEQSQV
jgi:hypothetical protein